jgi:hypothetical protein
MSITFKFQFTLHRKVSESLLESNTLLLFRKFFATYCETDKNFNVKTDSSYKGRCCLKNKRELNIK